MCVLAGRTLGKSYSITYHKRVPGPITKGLPLFMCLSSCYSELRTGSRSNRCLNVASTYVRILCRAQVHCGSTQNNIMVPAPPDWRDRRSARAKYVGCAPASCHYRLACLRVLLVDAVGASVQQYLTQSRGNEGVRKHQGQNTMLICPHPHVMNCMPTTLKSSMCGITTIAPPPRHAHPSTPNEYAYIYIYMYVCMYVCMYV